MVGTEPPCSGRQTLSGARLQRPWDRVPVDADARPALPGMYAWSLRAGRARRADSATGGRLSDVRHVSSPSLLLAGVT